MCVKFLSVSESNRDIKGIVLPAGSVRLQTRAWQFDPDFASQRQFPFLPPWAACIFFDIDHTHALLLHLLLIAITLRLIIVKTIDNHNAFVFKIKTNVLRSKQTVWNTQYLFLLHCLLSCFARTIRWAWSQMDARKQFVRISWCFLPMTLVGAICRFSAIRRKSAELWIRWLLKEFSSHSGTLLHQYAHQAVLLSSQVWVIYARDSGVMHGSAWKPQDTWPLSSLSWSCSWRTCDMVSMETAVLCWPGPLFDTVWLIRRGCEWLKNRSQQCSSSFLPVRAVNKHRLTLLLWVNVLWFMLNAWLCAHYKFLYYYFYYYYLLFFVVFVFFWPSVDKIPRGFKNYR